VVLSLDRIVFVVTFTQMLNKSINDNIIRVVADAVGGCNLDSGPWIAGGTARRLWFDIPWYQHDIDFFFSNMQSWRLADEKIDSILKKQQSEIDSKPSTDLFKRQATLMSSDDVNLSKYITKNAVTYRIKVLDRILSIQLIRNEFYNTLNDLWDRFDFTVCKFATNGKTILADLQAVDHCIERKLIMNDSTRTLSARRVIKYSLYGFDADRDIVTELLRQYNEKTINDNRDDYE